MNDAKRRIIYQLLYLPLPLLANYLYNIQGIREWVFWMGNRRRRRSTKLENNVEFLFHNNDPKLKARNVVMVVVEEVVQSLYALFYSILLLQRLRINALIISWEKLWTGWIAKENYGGGIEWKILFRNLTWSIVEIWKLFEKMSFERRLEIILTTVQSIYNSCSAAKVANMWPSKKINSPCNLLICAPENSIFQF